MQKYYKIATGFLVFLLGMRLECSDSDGMHSDLGSDLLSEIDAGTLLRDMRAACSDCPNPGEVFLAQLRAGNRLTDSFGERLGRARGALVNRALKRLAQLLGQVPAGKRGRGKGGIETSRSIVNLILTGPCNGQVQLCQVGTGNPEIDQAIALGKFWKAEFMSEDQYQRAIEQGAKLIEVFSVSQFEEVVGRGDFLVISDEQGEGMFILRNHGAGFILDPNRLDSLLSNHNLTRIVGLEWCAKNEPDHVESYYMDKCWTLCPDGPPQGFFDPNFTRIHPFVIKESDGTVDKNVVYCSYFSPIFSKFIFVRMYGYRAGTESTQSQARVLSSDYCSGPYFQLLPPQEAQQA